MEEGFGLWASGFGGIAGFLSLVLISESRIPNPEVFCRGEWREQGEERRRKEEGEGVQENRAEEEIGWERRRKEESGRFLRGRGPLRA